METDCGDTPAPLDLPKLARNIRPTLKQDPREYRDFGAYWWPVKRFLKIYYTRNDLYSLGDYEDPEMVATLPEVDEDTMLRLALEDYVSNKQFNMGSNRVETPDGDVHTIWDCDAGI